jgi:hypothetical protein
MPKRLRRRATELRTAASLERAEGDPPADPKLTKLMRELADELDAEAEREEAASAQTQRNT